MAPRVDENKSLAQYYERNLPHWQLEDRPLFVTFRLGGSLPTVAMTALRASKTRELGKRFREFDKELDKSSSGPLWLQDPRVAQIVVTEIANLEERRLCKVHAWVIMPNHVHLLLQASVPMAAITQKLKGSTARNANLLLGRTGKHFWQDESFDHWVRDEAEFEKVRQYIERNPVVAGLAKKEEDWRWSSAGKTMEMVKGNDGRREKSTD